MGPNTLYYGDNLDVLRRYVRDETVDLIYLDPPFNSNASYNVLFAEKNGSRAAAQFQAFEDTWHWDRAAAEAYQEVVEAGSRAGEAMHAFRHLLGDNDMLAYLAMMAPRLVELRRVLKPTGSITPQESAQPMRAEAASAGCYDSPWGRSYPKLQLLTVAELPAGKGIEMPPSQPVNVAYKRAGKAGGDDEGARLTLDG